MQRSTVLAVGLLVLVLFIVCVFVYTRIPKEGFEEGGTNDREHLSLGNLGLPKVSKTWDKDTVPHIIHQTAPSDKSKWHPIWHKCQAT